MANTNQSDKIKQLLEEASRQQSNIHDFFSKLKKKRLKNLDAIIHEMHYEVFEEIDCLECANCCSSISPTIYDRDIDRLAKTIKIKPAELIGQFLTIDHEKDYIFKETPCPFLMHDNYCVHYNDRPKACREYPHTNRKRMQQILPLTAKNAVVCPAVFLIYKKLKDHV